MLTIARVESRVYNRTTLHAVNQTAVHHYVVPRDGYSIGIFRYSELLRISNGSFPPPTARKNNGWLYVVRDGSWFCAVLTVVDL